MKLKLTKATVVDFLMMNLGTAICAAAIFFFLMPSHLAVASISGLSIVLSNVIPLSVSAITMIFNILLLVVGFLLIGPEFGAKTVYTSIVLPIFMGILEAAFPNFQSIMGDAFIDMICYLFLVSLGLSMLFVRNASSGGLDIVAKLLNKYFRMELGKAMSMAGMVVALSSGLVYDAKTVVLSVLGTYLNGIVLDHFIFGIDKKRRVCIFSPKLEEIRDFIINTLHSGATIYESYGAYEMTPRREIIAVVDKNEYAQLMKFVNKVDPTAFMTIYDVNEVCYQPKKIPSK
ncbi:MAG: YitT family protein [Clostridia bacterium]|nr:YitT family protein [Clostridia bacterium]